MCDCIQKVTETTLEHIAKLCASKGEKLSPLNTTFERDGMQNTVFTMSSNTINGEVLKTDFVWRSTFIKKDGTQSKQKAHHISLMFTFCPFCGEKYGKEPSP